MFASSTSFLPNEVKEKYVWMSVTPRFEIQGSSN